MLDFHPLVSVLGLTPLLVAVSKGNVKCLELLLSGGADVNCCETKRGRSSLHLATKKNAKEIVVRLLDEVNLSGYIPGATECLK